MRPAIKTLLTGSFLVIAIVLGVFLFQRKTAEKTVSLPEKRSVKNGSGCEISKANILCDGVWEVDEVIHTIKGKTSHFQKGGINTTGIKYELMDFVFNDDGTGRTTQKNGTEVYLFRWSFADSSQRAINLSVDNSITYHWYMVEITPNYLHATVPLNISGDSGNLESFRYRRISNVSKN